MQGKTILALQPLSSTNHFARGRSPLRRAELHPTRLAGVMDMITIGIVVIIVIVIILVISSEVLAQKAALPVRIEGAGATGLLDKFSRRKVL